MCISVVLRAVVAWYYVGDMIAWKTVVIGINSIIVEQEKLHEVKLSEFLAPRVLLI